MYHHFGWDGDTITSFGNDQAVADKTAQVAKGAGGGQPPKEFMKQNPGGIP
jgi:hypothetical protein